MEAGDTPTPPPSKDPITGEEVRRATFPQALRGYDRQAVHDMLDRVADWMEGKAGAVSRATPGMREEIAKVGERTAGILTAAEEAARNLRDEAAEYAERLRADADDEARKARLNASQRMDEMIAEAEEKAQTIIDDAVARRRQLNVAISSLIDRRDEIAAEATRLADELMAAVGQLRRPELQDEDVVSGAVPDPVPPVGSEEDLEPPSEEFAAEEPPSDELETGEEPPSDEFEAGEEPSSDEFAMDDEMPAIEEEETQVHPGPDSEDAEVVEDDNPEVRRRPTLLVDPDEED